MKKPQIFGKKNRAVFSLRPTAGPDQFRPFSIPAIFLSNWKLRSSFLRRGEVPTTNTTEVHRRTDMA